MADAPIDELHAAAMRTPEKPAIIFPQSGWVENFASLDDSANRLAQALIGRGLEAGAMIAVLLENRPEIFTIAWAARRAGLYYAMLNTHLKPRELGYLIADCEARLLITSRALLATVPGEIRRRLPVVVVDGGTDAAAVSLAELVAPFAAATLPPRPIGREFLYSSGTSGRPKGIRFPLLGADQRGVTQPGEKLLDHTLRFGPESVYLSPAPLYHAAPHVYSLHSLARGVSVVALDKFDPESALRTIARYRVTHSQWVPTMFIRMLTLPEAVRARYDLASHQRAVHAAAPCPVHVKEKMIAWWGPILVEYYAGSERIGTTLIESDEWLAHKGSVGRPIYGTVHILDDDGRDLPPGEVGGVWFEGTGGFAYHKDQEKTAAAYNARGFATYGDLGTLDDEGYLYLSDRRSDLILSGGSNVYPAEIESVLLEHPLIDDAGVVGIADPDLGEVVLAVVQPVAAPDRLGLTPEAVIAFCRERMASLKCPRAVIFVDKLPRTPTGKLLRRELKEKFRSEMAPAAGF
jgi:long-chain acyl-CoA synthetase